MFYGHYTSIFNHCDIMGLKICRIRWKNANLGLLRCSRSFRSVPIESSYETSYQLLIVTGILSRIVSELLQLIVQILDTLRFRATLWGLGTTYDVHLGLIVKGVVDFLLVLIELFTLGVTAESLRANRDRISAICLSVRLSHACIVTKRKKDLSRFLYHTKDNLA